MSRISCFECQSRLDAYINRDLPLRKRQRVAHHLHQCEACYAAYTNLRGLTQELRADLSFMGQPGVAQLDQMWLAIQTDMSHARPVRRRFKRRYGLAALILLLALILPWSLKEHEFVLAFPLQSAQNQHRPAPIPAGLTPESPVAHGGETIVDLHVTSPCIPPAETPAAPEIAAAPALVSR
jgi:anti-sigma factor RsiW